MKKYLKDNKKYIILEIICSNLYTIFIGMIPIIIKYLFDHYQNFTIKTFIMLVLSYLFVVVSGLLFQYLSQYYAWKRTVCLERDMRYDLMNHILNFNYQDYHNFQKEEYLSVFSNDITAISDQYFEKVIDMIKSVFMILIYGVYMIYFLNIYIASVIVVCSLLSLWLPKLTGEKLSQKRANHLQKAGELLEVESDLLSGFALTNKMTKNKVMKYFDNFLNILKDAYLQYGVYKAFTIVFNGFVMYLLDISAFLIAGILLLMKVVSVGTLSASLTYVKQFIWPIRYIIDDINEINAIKKVITKDEFILKREFSTSKAIKEFNELELKDIDLTLEDFKMKDVHVLFEKGKKYLLYGESGSGKSTLFNLLNKQIQMDKGKITIDHQDYHSLDLSQLISGVYRGNHIYHTSFINNITMFNTYTLEKLNDYLKTNPNEKINSLMKVENCSLLSNGEQQIVSLIRSYIIDTPIVLLDEAFMSIDIKNRDYFVEMFLKNSDKTIIMISHNLKDEYLNYFDRMYKVENGKIFSHHN